MLSWTVHLYRQRHMREIIESALKASVCELKRVGMVVKTVEPAAGRHSHP
jgi:hypothetical protein